MKLSRDINAEISTLRGAIAAVGSIEKLLNRDEMTRCALHSASKYNGTVLDINQVAREEYRYGQLDAELDRCKDAIERLTNFIDVHITDELTIQDRSMANMAEAAEQHLADAKG